MKAGSIGEMPPRIRVSSGFSWRTATAASRTMRENASHSRSISKSQWDLLFGSFQNITASTGIDGKGLNREIVAGARELSADENLGFRVVENGKPGTA